MSDVLVREDIIESAPRFDTENISRIYRGEPALVDGQEASEILTPKVLEAATYAAQGLTYQQIADRTGCVHNTAKEKVAIAYKSLGVLHKYGLAPYFPIDPDEPLSGGKNLTIIKDRTAALEILEAVSTGYYYGEIALTRGITPDSARGHVSDIMKTWRGINHTVEAVRTANRIRSGHVRAIESASGPMEPEDIARLTFPNLARLESAIVRRYAAKSR